MHNLLLHTAQNAAEALLVASGRPLRTGQNILLRVDIVITNWDSKVTAHLFCWYAFAVIDMQACHLQLYSHKVLPVYGLVHTISTHFWRLLGLALTKQSANTYQVCSVPQLVLLTCMKHHKAVLLRFSHSLDTCGHGLFMQLWPATCSGASLKAVVSMMPILQAKAFINEAHYLNDAGLHCDVWPASWRGIPDIEPTQTSSSNASLKYAGEHLQQRTSFNPQSHARQHRTSSVGIGLQLAWQIWQEVLAVSVRKG